MALEWMDTHILAHFYANFLNSTEVDCEVVTGQNTSFKLPPWLILKHDKMVKSRSDNKLKSVL